MARSLKKNNFINRIGFLLTNPKIKIGRRLAFSRSIKLNDSLYRKKFSVYNGKKFMYVPSGVFTAVGHKLGEFVFTRAEYVARKKKKKKSNKKK